MEIKRTDDGENGISEAEKLRNGGTLSLDGYGLNGWLGAFMLQLFGLTCDFGFSTSFFNSDT